MDYLKHFGKDVKRVRVGTTITINAWGKFPTRTMKCIRMERDEEYKRDIFVFDNGIQWDEMSLASNFSLWNSRNGYLIAEG